jgi:hypothetical protein
MQVDETIELKLWCFPTSVGELEDAIVCTIQDNPTPVEFPIHAFGDTPKVELHLEGQEDPVEPTEEEVAAAAAAKAAEEAAAAKKKPAKKGAEPVLPALTGNKVCSLLVLQPLPAALL